MQTKKKSAPAPAAVRKYDLTVFERLLLAFQILPASGGSFEEARRVRTLRQRLKLDEAEREATGYKENDGTPRWDPPAADALGTRAFEMNEQDTGVIAHGFKLLEDGGNVPTSDAFMDLYEKFAGAVEAIGQDEKEAQP